MSKKTVKRPPKQIKPSKGMRIFYLVSGILLIVLGLLLTIVFPVPGILAVAYGIFCIFWSKKYKPILQKEEPAKEAVKTEPVSVEPAVEQLEETEPIPTPVQAPVEQPSTPPEKTERHRVAGTSYRIDAIKSLGIENPDYELTKQELVEDYLTDESIYEYEFPLFDAELIEEPDNEVDPNAIMVVLNGVHVGYIKAGSCNRVKKRMREDKIKRVTARIFGGRYKYVSTDYDDNGNERYSLEQGERAFTVMLTLHLKD